MNVRMFAALLGVVFFLVGIAGLTGIMVQPYSGLPLSFEKNEGTLLGLFHVNMLHNLVHVLFGVGGIIAYVTGSCAAKTYAKIVGVAYVALAILGAIPVPMLQTTFGFIPIHGNDVWLHGAIGVVALYFGFAAPLPKSETTA